MLPLPDALSATNAFEFSELRALGRNQAQRLFRELRRNPDREGCRLARRLVEERGG